MHTRAWDHLRFPQQLHGVGDERATHLGNVAVDQMVGVVSIHVIPSARKRPLDRIVAIINGQSALNAKYSITGPQRLGSSL